MFAVATVFHIVCLWAFLLTQQTGHLRTEQCHQSDRERTERVNSREAHTQHLPGDMERLSAALSVAGHAGAAGCFALPPLVLTDVTCLVKGKKQKQTAKSLSTPKKFIAKVVWYQIICKCILCGEKKAVIVNWIIWTANLYNISHMYHILISHISMLVKSVPLHWSRKDWTGIILHLCQHLVYLNR